VADLADIAEEAPAEDRSTVHSSYAEEAGRYARTSVRGMMVVEG
jgi:hypothetical protein